MRCVIAAGGTAGHVLSALAVAEALTARGVFVTFACVIVGGMLLSPICSLLVIPTVARLWMPEVEGKPGAVRIEEMVNYFPYAYPKPESSEVPFRPTVTVMPSPWNATNKLVHIAIKGYDLKSEQRPRANLVFLVDVSGSMAEANKLPLVIRSLWMLVNQLEPTDRIAIVVYAGAAQYMMVPMLAAGLPVGAIAVATVVVNLRHVFYGLSLLDRLPGGRQALDARMGESSSAIREKREQMARQASFKAQSFLFGHYCETLTTALFVLPSAQPGRVDVIEVHRRIGLQQLPGRLGEGPRLACRPAHTHLPGLHHRQQVELHRAGRGRPQQHAALEGQGAGELAASTGLDTAPLGADRGVLLRLVCVAGTEQRVLLPGGTPAA